MSTEVRVLLLSRYAARGASSRVRFYQYLHGLACHGIEVSVSPLLPDAYLDALYAGRRPGFGLLARSLASRAAAAVRRGTHDVVWIEGELFPWAPFLLDRLAIGRLPTVVDFDDAIFHRYDCHPSLIVRRVLGRKIDRLMRAATVVVAGNDYVAERARRVGARHVEVVPSAVDPAVHRPLSPVDGPGARIGWIGTPTTAPYLDSIAAVVRRLDAERAMDIVLIGAPPGTWRTLRATVIPWRLDQEPADLNRFDIGVMPVPDRPFERGKCGFKLVQYMACGRPVVASPVGANRQIVQHGVNGLLADSGSEWEAALRQLSTDAGLRRSMGDAGRRSVLESYSTTKVLPRLARILQYAAAAGA